MAMPDYPPLSTSTSPPKLLDQVRVWQLGCAKRTETSYVHWMERYILFHGKRHPRSNNRGQTPVPMLTAVPRGKGDKQGK